MPPERQEHNLIDLTTSSHNIAPQQVFCASQIGPNHLHVEQDSGQYSHRTCVRAEGCGRTDGSGGGHVLVEAIRPRENNQRFPGASNIISAKNICPDGNLTGRGPGRDPAFPGRRDW